MFAIFILEANGADGRNFSLKFVCGLSSTWAARVMLMLRMFQ